MSKVRIIGWEAVKVTIPMPAVPIKVLGISEKTTNFEVFNPSGNADIWVGSEDVSSATHVPRPASSLTAFSALDLNGEPRHFDLSETYITGTAGEEVFVQWQKPKWKEI